MKMPEELSPTADVTPANVADDAVGIPKSEQPLLQSDGESDSVTAKSRHWFIAYVGPRKEKSVRDMLLRQGYEAFAATQWEMHVWKNGRRKKVEQPVITHYVFVKVTERERLQIVANPEIHSFVTDKASEVNQFGRHKLAVIPDSQIEVLQAMLADSDHRVQFVTTGFSVGEEVQVLGWGENTTGTIVRIQGDKARYIGIRINQLGCAYMEISPKLLVKIP